MPSASPLKKFMSWLNCEDEEEEFDVMETPTPSPAPTATPSKRQRGPLTLHSGNEGGMEIRHPRTLDDRMAIGMDLKQRRMVTLDLTRLPENEAKPFLEFVYGVVFALDATAEKVTEGIYLLAPRGVSVHNDTEASESPLTVFSTARLPSVPSSGQEELFWQGR